MYRAVAALFFRVAAGCGGKNKMSTETGSMVFAGNDPGDEMSLLDLLDHVLDQGVILRGNLVISLAGVDLVYLGLDVVLTSVETAMRHITRSAPAAVKK